MSHYAANNLLITSLVFLKNILMNDKRINDLKAYWKENTQLVFLLLAIWFIVSFGMAILCVDILDNIRFFGFKLGFWMAQQGSIYCFVILIFVYVYKVNKLDQKYRVNEDSINSTPNKTLKRNNFLN